MRFDIFTTVPQSFFEDSLAGRFEYHPCDSDVGLKQTTPFEFDVAATRAAVEAFITRAPGEATTLAQRLAALGDVAVVSDISPLGLMAANKAGLPSFLIENFTWDWLYAPLVEEDQGFGPIVAWMGERFGEASQRIQARPVCDPTVGADLVVDPVCRTPRRAPAEVRADFEVAADDALVLITTGGVSQPLPFRDQLLKRSEATFLVTGSDRTIREENVWRFHKDDLVYLPDLVGAADLVVAKLGYSTVAEVWAAGCPLGYVGREDFRETGPLRGFVESEIPSVEIGEEDFASGRWLDRIDALLALEPAPAKSANGSHGAARHILETLRR